MNTRNALLALAAIPVLTLGACGQDEEPQPAPSSTTSSTSTKSSAPSTVAEATSEPEMTESSVETSPVIEEPEAETNSGGILPADQLQVVRDKCDFLMQRPCTDEEVFQYSQLWVNSGTAPQPGAESQYESYDDWITDLGTPTTE